MTAALLAGDPETTAQTIAVVGDGAACSQVVDVLVREGLQVSVGESLDAIRGAEVSPSVIVVISDQAMAARSRALASAHGCFDDTDLVLVCSSIDGRELRAALDAGAVGIVLAAEVSAALGPCLAAIRAGQICVPHGNCRQIEQAVLSAREKQVLGLVVMGYMNVQIAERLFLAESTVKSHLSSAFSKLEVHSRHEAVDLILNPDHGRALGILALGGESLQHRHSATA